MADKVKTAFLLAGGCAGCEMSVVDLSEKLVDVLDALETGTLSPADLLALPEDEVHALVGGVLDADEAGTEGGGGGMAPLLAAIERLPAGVGGRLVRAYLAAVME